MASRLLATLAPLARHTVVTHAVADAGGASEAAREAGGGPVSCARGQAPRRRRPGVRRSFSCLFSACCTGEVATPGSGTAAATPRGSFVAATPSDSEAAAAAALAARMVPLSMTPPPTALHLVGSRRHSQLRQWAAARKSPAWAVRQTKSRPRRWSLSNLTVTQPRHGVPSLALVAYRDHAGTRLYCTHTAGHGRWRTSGSRCQTPDGCVLAGEPSLGGCLPPMGMVTCRARPSSGAAPPASSSGGGPSRPTGGILANAVYSTNITVTHTGLVGHVAARHTAACCGWNELSSHTPATHISCVFVMRPVSSQPTGALSCPAGWSTRDPKRPRPPQGVCPSGGPRPLTPPPPPPLASCLVCCCSRLRLPGRCGAGGGGAGGRTLPKAATSDGAPRGRRGRRWWWCGAPAPCLVLSLSGWFGCELPARRQALPREALTLACGCWL